MDTEFLADTQADKTPSKRKRGEAGRGSVGSKEEGYCPIQASDKNDWSYQMS